VLGRIVEEGKQRLLVVDHLGDRLGPLDAVVADQRLDRPLGVGPVLGADDLVERPAGAGLHALGQGSQDVGDLVHPAALLAGGGEHLAERPPQPQRPVADHHHRRAHPAPAQIAQQLRPRIGRLALAVGDGDQLLTAIGAHPDDDQPAQPSLLAEADVEVDPVGPAVHVVDPTQVPPRECGPLRLPLLHQPGDDRGRQPRRGAEEGLQRWDEVAA
jgi:hypothetical protein